MPGPIPHQRLLYPCAGLLLALSAVAVWCLWYGENSAEVENESESTETLDGADGQASVSAASAAGYTGSQSCIPCHAEISDMWKTHPMSRSVTRANRMPTDSEQIAKVLTGTPAHYEVSVNDQQMVHKEVMINNEGQAIYEQSFPMEYVVGSGQRAFAYLYQEGELLFQSPLNWYSATQQWDLSPGYLPKDPRRFRRRVTDECLSCHVGRVNTVGTLPDRFENPPFAELSIGCENCHGPGQEHIAFHDDTLNIDTSGRTDPIVNPSRLSPVHRESVCNQCHLQPAARIAVSDRSQFDFRPGMAYHEVWLATDVKTAAGADGQSRAVSQVQQMRSSLCFQSSDGRMGCVSCHNPHRIPASEERVAFYRNRCLNCHGTDSCQGDAAERTAAVDSCITCHMPKGRPGNISHVSQTDHRILRSPSSGVSAEEVPQTEMEFILLDADHVSPASWEGRRALSVGTWARLNKKAQPVPESVGRMMDSCLEQQPDDGLLLSTLGAYWLRKNDPVRARLYLNDAAQIPIAKESSYSALLDLTYADGDWGRAGYYADRCLELDPGHPGVLAVHADILMNQGRLEDAIAAAELSVERDPTRIAVRNWLAEAYDRNGQLQKAQQMRNIVRQMLAAEESARP